MEDGDIREFYKGQTIFLTGGTGFLGQVLLEKLLRVCSDLTKIYLLMRVKRGKDVEERLREIIHSEFFMRMKKQVPNYMDKIQIIAGDCEKPSLGIKPEDRDLLKREVTCVIHTAATVKFNQALRTAFGINVQPVIDMIDLAKNMDNLKAFIYVSTIYSNKPCFIIKESCYEPPVEPMKLKSILEALDEDTLVKITPVLLGEWLNTYTFTKCLAENLCSKAAFDGLPVAIVRPAIVASTAEDPVPGWFSGFHGSQAIMLRVAAGMIRVTAANNGKITPVVPCDYVAGCILAAAWDICSEREQDTSNMRVYNFAGFHKNPLTWKDFMNLSVKWGRTYPISGALWYPFVINPGNMFSYKILFYILQILPAYLVDFVIKCRGGTPICVHGTKQLKKVLDLTGPFMNRAWKFQNYNVNNLWRKMSAADKQLFKFNMDDLDWTKFMEHYVLYGRYYGFEDRPNTLDRARRRLVFLGVIHYTLVVGFLYILYCFLRGLFCH